MKPADGQLQHNRTLQPASRRQLFERLYDACESPVLNYCYYRLGNWVDAEDVAHLVFEKAYAGLPGFRAEGERSEDAMRSWLFRIAHNEVANHHRHRTRHQTVALDRVAEIHDAGANPEAEALRTESHQQVRTLLGSLTDDQRQVVELRLAGLSDAEIGGLLERSPGAVRAVQFRAVTRLRMLMQSDSAPKDRSDV